MSAARKVVEPVLTRSTAWTAERVATLTLPEIKQLRANAERLQDPGIVELCTAALKARPRPAPAARKPAKAKEPVKA